MLVATVAAIVVAVATASVAGSVATRAMAARGAATNDKSVGRKFMEAAVSGAISCSVTHSIVVPIDVVKTRMQTDPTLAGKSTLAAGQAVVRSGGRKVLLQGLAATFSGYWLQGFCKFGFYDLIKSSANKLIADERTAQLYRLPILIASSALAEVVASWALCPLETTRIFMMLHPEVNGGMLSAISKIYVSEGLHGFFRGLNLIMVKQIPYTCAKLAGYDIMSEASKTWVRGMNTRRAAAQKQRSGRARARARAGDGEDDDPSRLTGAQKVGIQLSNGVAAGLLAAVISQPADVLLSKVCGQAGSLKECILIGGPMDIVRHMRDLGWRGAYAGLQPRALSVGAMTMLQFYVYEQSRAFVATVRPARGVAWATGKARQARASSGRDATRPRDGAVSTSTSRAR